MLLPAPVGRVYGDSTPFPYEVDYIELIDAAVDCAVALLLSQNGIARGQRDAVEAEARVRLQLKELGALGKGVEATLTGAVADVSEATKQIAQQVIQSARGHVDTAFASLRSELEKSKLEAVEQAEAARRSGHSAVEDFLAKHMPIGSHVSTRLSLSGERYAAHVRLATAFGLRGEFAAELPAEHGWSRPRRVSELAAGAEIRLPQEAGWLSKRVELAPVKLDRFHIVDVFANGRGGWVQLRRAPNSGPGLQVRLQLGEHPLVTVGPIGEDGSSPTAEPTQLDDEGCARILAFWQALLESSSDIVSYRGEMRSATFGGQPLEKVEPSIVARAIIAYIAPLTVEISRRSGAIGELVLRRDVGDGRREESYLKHEELLKRIHTVPSQELRCFFDLLRLNGSSQPPVTAAAGVVEPLRPELSTGTAAAGVVEPVRPERSTAPPVAGPRRRPGAANQPEATAARPDSERGKSPPTPPPLVDPSASPGTSGFFGKRPAEEPSGPESAPAQAQPSEPEAAARTR